MDWVAKVNLSGGAGERRAGAGEEAEVVALEEAVQNDIVDEVDAGVEVVEVEEVEVQESEEAPSAFSKEAG
jgi:hypothetical protein